MNDLPYLTLSENDLSDLFNLSKRTDNIEQKKSTTIFVAIFIILFVILNLPAYFKKITYRRPINIIVPKEKAIAKKQPYSELNPNTITTIADPAENESLETDAMNNNEIYLPTVNIKAPINWNIQFDEKSVRTGLETGVIHLDGTASPGEVGNVFITGHSSNLPMARGDYKAIFATLPKIKLNDQIFIIRGGRLYSYKVENVFETTPDKVEVMTQSKKSMLTLSTCVPIGTAARRFIVQAKQTAPDPQSNQPFSGALINLTKQIPAA